MGTSSVLDVLRRRSVRKLVSLVVVLTCFMVFSSVMLMGSPAFGSGVSLVLSPQKLGPKYVPFGTKTTIYDEKTISYDASPGVTITGLSYKVVSPNFSSWVSFVNTPPGSVVVDGGHPFHTAFAINVPPLSPNTTVQFWIQVWGSLDGGKTYQMIGQQLVVITTIIPRQWTIGVAAAVYPFGQGGGNPGGSLVVPAGAVAAATDVTATAVVLPQQMPATDGGYVNLACSFEPDGLQFSQPIICYYVYPPGLRNPRAYGYDEDLEMWVPIAGSSVDPNTKMVIFPIAHFSMYGVGGDPLTTSTPASSPLSLVLVAFVGLVVAGVTLRGWRTSRNAA